MFNARDYGYGPVNQEYPSIIGFDTLEQMQTVAAKWTRKKVSTMMQLAPWSPATTKYRVKTYAISEDGELQFLGFISGFCYPDGMVGDTVTGLKHPMERVRV